MPAICLDFQAEPFDGAPIGHGQQVPRAPLNRRHVVILLGIVIGIALAARLLMAYLLSAPCNDAYFYFCIADLLTMQKYEQAFTHLNLNTYPAILAVLHAWGLDWVTAGKLWGVAVSTVTVLPLFGWVRRQWGDRIALAAVLLYAVHPEMIELGVEPIREPTFWLFLAVGLYAIDRAFDELHWRFFCLAGTAITLAFFTRTEGLLLLIVLAIGISMALFKHKHWKRRLKVVSGVSLCLAMAPILVVAVNLSLLRNHSRWEFGRLNHLSYLAAVVWSEEQEPAAARVPAEPSPANQVVVPPAVAAVAGAATPNNTVHAEPTTAAVAPAAKSLSTRFLKFTSELNSAYGPLSFVLFFVGAVTFWRRRLLRHLVPLMIPSVAVMAAVWVRLSAPSGGINGRYFLAMYFLIAPVCAVGLLSVMRFIAARPWGWGRLRWNGPSAATVALTLVAAILIADALTSRHSRREADLKIAARLLESYGPFDRVIVDHFTARIGYAVQHQLPETLAFIPLKQLKSRPGTGLVLVSTKGDPPSPLPELRATTKPLGYQEVDLVQRDARRNDLIVYIKTRDVASSPSRPLH